MFSYEDANITYAVTSGNLDGSSDIEYTLSLNKREAVKYTKARMLGEDLSDILSLDRIEREIIRLYSQSSGNGIIELVMQNDEWI